MILDNRKVIATPYTSDATFFNNIQPQNSKGYRVLVTQNGAVSSKLPFFINPNFEGEHNFYLHGIHHIIVSKILRER